MSERNGKGWNYRIMRHTDADGDAHYGIHEVYYDHDGEPRNWTVNPIAPIGENMDELSHDFGLMFAALRHPVLSTADASEVEASNILADLLNALPELRDAVERQR